MYRLGLVAYLEVDACEGVLSDSVAQDRLGKAECARVREHLGVLIASPEFRDTTRMKRFLKYIVDETLSGRAGRLKGYSIGLEVFDRPENFDPQSDTIVRVQAGQLRRRLDRFYTNSGRDADMRVLVPRGSYVPRFEFRRPEPALAHSLSADTELVTRKAVAHASPTEGTKTTSFAEHAAGVCSERPGVVVLSLTDLTLSERKDYFAEGLTAEIVNALVQFRYLRVVTRTATVTSAGPDVGLAQLAQSHDVDFVLTGTVRRADENVRVSVSLIEAATGQHIYSKVFDRRATARNLFDIQDQIASYVAASIAAPYGAITRYHRRILPDMKLSAYEVILRFYDMNLAPSRHKAATLRADIDRVIEANPKYSVPWAIRSLLDSFMVGQTLVSRDVHVHLENAMRAAKTSVRLNADNAMGYLALLLANFYAGRFDAYETAAERCVRLNPNDAAALVHLAITRAFRDDLSDAHALHARALDLLPRPPRWFSAVPAAEMLLSGQYQYVLTTLGSVRPERGVWSQMLSLAALGHLGRPRVAAQLLEKFRGLHKRYDTELKACFLRWHPADPLRETMLRGWEKAGLSP